MRAVRLLALSLVAIVLTALVATPAQAATPGYAALGDSYSSGLGAGSSYSGGSCDRSPQAFSALWSATHAGVRYVSLACAGATTNDVAVQAQSIPADTSLVSVTAGGNDVGFSTIMTTCALHGTSACVSAVNAAEAVETASGIVEINTSVDNVGEEELRANVTRNTHPPGGYVV